MIRRIGMTVVLLTAVLLPAMADGTAAGDLAECRKLVVQKKWAKAVEAYAALFEAHEGAPEIVAALRDIEDDLKTCSFRLDYEPIEPKHLWGAESVKRFSRTSLKVELTFTEHSKPLWITQSGLWILDIRFHDRITIEVEAPPKIGSRPLFAVVCYDIEKRGGYLAAVGQTVNVKGVGRVAGVGLARLDQGMQVSLVKTHTTERSPKLTFTRDSSSIRLKRGRKQVAKAVDGRYRGGYIAFGNVWPKRVVIKGRLDEGYWRKIAGDHEEKAFATWLTEKWDPGKAIPAWVRKPADAPSARRATKLALPADSTVRKTVTVRNLMDRCLDGDPNAALELLPIRMNQPPRTSTYLGAYCSIGLGEYAGAERQLGVVVAAEPDFAPALALRGVMRLVLRRIEEASADFAAARKKDERNGMAYWGQVQLAIFEGDLDKATKVLAAAKAAGAAFRYLEGLPERVHRARRGPLWSHRFDVSTPHFRIASDHSEDLCRQVGKTLEAALESYAGYFPDVVMPKRKARVYVFANRSGYLGYARAVAKDLRWAAGAYDRSLRELVLYLPENRRHFVHTIRHEGFHRFVHEYLDRAPIWFNEGAAEYFASASQGYGVGLKFGAPNERALELIRAEKGKLAPVKELLVMPRREFMAKAPLHYAQSWAVIHYMLKSPGDRMRLAFRAYFASLRAGLSPEEAYRKHLERHVERIEKGYHAHIEKL